MMVTFLGTSHLALDHSLTAHCNRPLRVDVLLWPDSLHINIRDAS